MMLTDKQEIERLHNVINGLERQLQHANDARREWRFYAAVSWFAAAGAIAVFLSVVL